MKKYHLQTSENFSKIDDQRIQNLAAVILGLLEKGEKQPSFFKRCSEMLVLIYNHENSNQ